MSEFNARFEIKIKISGSLDHVDPLNLLADKLVALAQEPTTPEMIDRVRFGKCPFCKGRATLAIDETKAILTPSGIEGEPDIELTHFTIIPCCSVRYTKRHDQPSMLMLRRMKNAEKQQAKKAR